MKKTDLKNINFVGSYGDLKSAGWDETPNASLDSIDYPSAVLKKFLRGGGERTEELPMLGSAVGSRVGPPGSVHTIRPALTPAGPTPGVTSGLTPELSRELRRGV